MPIVLKSESLGLLDSLGFFQASTGTALPFMYEYIKCAECVRTYVRTILSWYKNSHRRCVYNLQYTIKYVCVCAISKQVLFKY